jgi:ParB family chromosome partitioning protein
MNMAIPAEKVGAEKIAEKLVEKRRALGRGLESLLPGPRVVPANDPTLAQNARKDGAPSGVLPAPTAVLEAEGAGATVESASAAERVSGTVDLQAVAARRTADGVPVLELALDVIDDNPHQSRLEFDEEALQELAASIGVQGVIQPIVVRPGKDGRYVLILGERRMRASKLAGKTSVPAIVKRVSEQQAAEMTLIENLQREDLDCLEQAEAFHSLSQEFGLTQEEIGKRVGASRETVSNYLRLLKLPDDVKTYLSRGFLTYSHARELLVLDDNTQISKLATLAVKKRMSVLQLEDEVMNVAIPHGPEEDRRPNSPPRAIDPNVRAAQRSLETVLGMRVRIRDRKGKGKITIEYGTLEDFDRVVGMLKGSG